MGLSTSAEVPAVYTSEEGYRAVVAWYDQQVDQLPVPCESRWVDTSAGGTHLLIAGPPDAPPMVVLHGMNMNAAAMTPAIRQFASSRRVYAIDVIGMPGKSAGTRPRRTGPGYPRWLAEVMQALEILEADLVGQSFGGWIILKLAERAPERIRTAVLLDSGGLVPFTWKGQMQAGLAAVLYMMWSNDRTLEWAVSPFSAPGVSLGPEKRTLLGLAYQHVRLDVDPKGLPCPDKDALAPLEVPMFVSYGAHDLFFPADAAVQRAEALWPERATTEVVEEEGHLFSAEGEQARYERVAAFLNIHSAA